MTATRAAVCDGKAPLPPQAARDLAGRMRRQHRAPVQAYHCRFCFAWHVGVPLK